MRNSAAGHLQKHVMREANEAGVPAKRQVGKADCLAEA
jgi:hypothetical protein